VTIIPPVLTLVLAGGRSERLHALGRQRTAPALPFGGKYRVIDFTLSNCVHSGLTRIGVLTQYAPLSLNGHIGIGRAWDLDRRDGGIRLLQPYVRQRSTNWYQGTADALQQNRNVIEDAHARHILVLSGDLIYKMDYGDLIRFHEERGAALTVVTVPAPATERERYGYVTLRDGYRITGFEEKPRKPEGGIVSAAIYLFRARDLLERLAAPGAGPDLVLDVIAPMIRDGCPVVAYPHRDYWRDIGTLDAFYAANMDLVRPVPPLNLHDPDWLIFTPSEDRAPSILACESEVVGSLVAHGSLVEGTVRRSILFPGVHVGSGAVIEDSIVLHDSRVLSGARVTRAIIDKRVRIGEGACVGEGEARPHREHPRDLRSGLCLVGKGAEVPAGAHVGTNVMIEIGVEEADFPSLQIPSGATVRPAAGRTVRGGVA
jgi:glucose-1-phosphate adenylyltransferase